MVCLPFFHDFRSVAHDATCYTHEVDFNFDRYHRVVFLKCTRCGKRKFTIGNDGKKHNLINEIKLGWLDHEQILLGRRGELYLTDDYELVDSGGEWRVFKPKGTRKPATVLTLVQPDND